MLFLHVRFNLFSWFFFSSFFALFESCGLARKYLCFHFSEHRFLFPGSFSFYAPYQMRVLEETNRALGVLEPKLISLGFRLNLIGIFFIY